MPDNTPAVYDWIVKYTSWHLNGNSLLLSCLTEKGWQAQLIIRAISDDIWNYSFIPPDSEFIIRVHLINESYSEKLYINVEENASGLMLKGINLTLSINRNPWRMVFYNDADEVIFSHACSERDQHMPLGYFSDNKNIIYTEQSFCLRPDEYIYGLGEHSNIFFGAGQKLKLRNETLTRSDLITSNKNIPFFFSSRGYGMFINSVSEIAVEFGTGTAASCRVLNKNKMLDVFIISGSSPVNIISNYTLLTGRAGVPPKWSFGVNVAVSDEHLSAAAIDEIINDFQQEKIPTDVLLICPSSFTSRRYSAFIRNTDLKKLFEQVHGRGLKVCLRVHPYISIESELYHEAKLKEYLVKKTNGEVYILSLPGNEIILDGVESSFRCKDLRGSSAALIDFTNPDAGNWYKELYKTYFDAGADMLSTEYGEEIPEDALLFNGEKGEAVHNLYSLLFTENVYELTRSVKSYGTTFSRSGTAGIQRYAICWSHNSGTDYEHLAYSIKRAISSGLSGIPFWVTDIDMISSGISKELYIRWIQFQMFCSHSRIPGTVVRNAGADKQTVKILRSFIQFRYSIFPYIYSTAIESSLTGIPVIRSMYLAFPEDQNTFNKDLQYMFGCSLLVAPVYNENNMVTVYLPEGDWMNINTNERYSGGRNILIESPLEILPVFMKSGSIVPMIEAAERIPENFIEQMTLSIYPDKEKSYYKLYEDEGISEFDCILSNKKIIVNISSCRERSFRLRIYDPGIVDIMLNNTPLEIQTSNKLFVETRQCRV